MQAAWTPSDHVRLMQYSATERQDCFHRQQGGTMRASRITDRRVKKIAATVMMILLFLPGQVLLAQSGLQSGVVTSGAVSIERAGTVTNVNQSTEKASINWQSFNVKPAETVNFNQPGVSSVTLNRVIGNERSVIEGALNANGQVFLLNSNGILATKSSSINTGGFLASTLNISDEDFQAGRYVFQGNGSSASIINQGTIKASDGGYVALLGNTVSNQGIILATRGMVALASGDKIRLNFDNLSDGVDSLIGVTIDDGILNALVENRNAIYADGGRVFLTAKAANELLSAQVNTDGIIRAQTIGDLKGNIELYAHGGTANIAGTIDASAPNGGDGGFIETSGDHVKITDGTIIDTKAADGKNGTWLIDPDGFTIGATTNDGDMSAATLNAALANNDVIIKSVSGSGNNGTNDGNININGAVSWAANTLTLDATNNIFVNNVMTATGTAGLTANYGTGTNADETPMGLYTMLMDSNSRVDFSGTGTLRLGGEVYTVINNAAQLAAARNNPSGRYALGSNVSASGTTWIPLDNNNSSGFTGRFNGLGHALGVPLSGTAISTFGTIGNGAMVSNLGISGIISAASAATSKTTAGIIAEVNRGTIVGGYLTSGHIEVTNGAVHTTSLNSVGGLVGINYGLIAQSYSTANIVGVTGTTGGLVGVNENTGRIIDSWSEGSIRNTAYSTLSAITGSIGGLVGLNNGTIRRSYTKTAIQLPDSTVPSQRVGGFVGRNNGFIDEAYAGLVGTYLYSSAPNFGGFVGDNTGTITNAYTTALSSDSVVANWDAGFVYNNSGTIRNAYAVTQTTNNNVLHYGFAATNTGNIENAYWSTIMGRINTSLIATPTHTQGTTFLSENEVGNFSIYNFGANKSDIWGMSRSGYLMLRNIPVYIRTNSIPNYGTAAVLTATGLQGLVANKTADDMAVFTVIKDGAYVDAGVWNVANLLTGAPYTNIKGLMRINPRPLTISGAVDNKTYDGTTTTTLNSNASRGGLVGLVGSQTLNINYTSAEFRDGSAGTGKTVDLTYTVGDGTNGGKASNYIIANTTTATITPKPVDVTVTGNDKVYDGTTTATVDGQIDGVISNDDLAFAYASADFDSKNAGDRTVTVNGISLTGADAGNYTISGQNSATTDATINPRPVQVYGFADEGGGTRIDATGLNATNIIEGDDVTLGGSVGIAATTAGAQPIIDFSLLTVDNLNYTALGSIGSITIGNANLIFDGVAAGDASIAVSGTRTTVTQTTDMAVLDWLRFSLGADEMLVFNQPSSSSIVLNRVVTGIRSVIEGALRANGRVFILNSGGVLFAAGSSVNVGGLLASTFNMSDDDFLKGNNVFTVTRGNGSVIAAGDIVIADNGFIVLAGNHDVAHTGVTSGGDTALMASTDSLTLTLNPTNNTLTDYTIGNLTGDTNIGGYVRIGSTARGGRLLTAGDTVTKTSDFTLTTGTGGSWTWDQSNAITIGEGPFTGDFVNNNLNARNFSLRSREGDITINSAVDWTANTKFELSAKGDIFLNKSINATGANAGLELNYGNDYHLITPATFSSAVLDSTGKPVAQQIPAGTEFTSITLSGANSSLKMNGNNYTLIRNMDEFFAIDKATGTATGHFALANDIDATAWSAAHIGTPSVVERFSGTLAGLGHEIDNLTLNTPPVAALLGLISRIIENDGKVTTIRDLGITNIDITRDKFKIENGVGIDQGFGWGAGALIGASEGNLIIRQAYSTGHIVTSDSGGGLIGVAENPGFTTYIERSFSDVALETMIGDTIHLTGSGYFGGLVGRADTITITNSHATGSILAGDKRLDDNGHWVIELSSGREVGGLLGKANSVIIDNSYATGDVVAYGAASVGGLIGTVAVLRTQNYDNRVTNSFATGNVIGGMEVGGLIGSINNSSNTGTILVDNTYATGNVTGTIRQNGGMIGGLIGSAINSVIHNSFATGDVNTIAQNMSFGMGGLVGTQRGGSISDSYATGTVTDYSGRSMDRLVGNGSGTVSDSYYVNEKVVNTTQWSNETAFVRSEIADITQQNPEEGKNSSEGASGTSNGNRSGVPLDQYVYQYGDGGSGYSARVKAITVEDAKCDDGDESCTNNHTDYSE